MKAFISLTIILLICYMFGMIRSNDIECGHFMSRDYTTVLKGVAVLTVVWAHVGAALSVGNIQFIAGMGVALFLICSGYGLEISYQKKGLYGFWERRFLKLCIPYWIAVLGASLIQKTFTFHGFMHSIVFIIPGNWYMRYIIVCYLLFFVLKFTCERSGFFKKNETVLLLVAFGLWFILDSIYFANPVMPFLQARQMLSFPCGILIAKNKTHIDDWLVENSGGFPLVVWTSTGVICMGITQLHQIRELPHIISNMISLATVLPLALAVMILVKAIPKLFNNKYFVLCGVVSYEIFLIHGYTMLFNKPGLINQIIFVVVTLSLSIALHSICCLIDRCIKLVIQ